MMAVYVPVLPPAIYYMENFDRAPWRGCRGRTLLEILGECSRGDQCDICPAAARCVSLYDSLADSEKIDWRETVRHVTRYYK